MSVDSAGELMSYLPPVGWADVATKADIGIIRNEMGGLRAEMRGLRGEMRGDMAELRGEMRSVAAELRGEMAELRGAIAGLDGSLVARIAEAKDSMRVWTIATLIALIFGMAGLALSIAQLAR